jgi:signal transduction histidine kinase
LLDDHWAQVQVIDQGLGIAPDIQDQIFSPFFSTKSAGTGVGLSLCHSIIEKHGGRIWFESAPSGGTAFKLTLPRAQEPAQ